MYEEKYSKDIFLLSWFKEVDYVDEIGIKFILIYLLVYIKMKGCYIYN